MPTSSEWTPACVEKVLCIRGGWLAQTTPIPEKDIKVLHAGPHRRDKRRARERAKALVAQGVRE
eukprot:7481524-Pyramimonas_sp.AAC.1